MSTAIAPTAVPRLAPGVRLRQDPARGPLLLAPERVIVLNAIAAEVLRRCEDATFEALVAALAQEFDAPPERIAAETAQLLTALAEKGLVELAEPA